MENILISLPAVTNDFVIEKIVAFIRKIEKVGEKDYVSALLNDRFFVIRRDFSIEEYFSLEDALRVDNKIYVVVDKFLEFFTPYNGDPHRVSKFDFVDDNGDATTIGKNGWNIRDIVIFYKSTSRIEYYVTLSDPSNKIKKFSSKVSRLNYQDLNAHDIQIVVNAIKLLNQATEFDSVDSFH